MGYEFDYLREVRRTLEQPFIPERILCKNGSEFLFSVISGDMHYDDLVEQFEAQDPDSEWAIREWIAESLFHPGFVIVARAPGDVRPAGFLTFDTRVFVNDAETDGHVARVSTTLEPRTVYVSPDFRGRGFGDAFVQVLALQIPCLLECLAEASRGDLQNLLPEQITFSMQALCVSAKGFLFVQKAFAACDAELAAAGPVGRWVSPSRLEDSIHRGGFDEEDEPALASHSR
jgi:GNAT superfamily N-acetyltransferase